ncbi:respiratory nitrate reductase subunit delta (plasmid) [Burkholderia sp. SFA1]|uniref:nitrate reductase molybdenum cofactor assembly chaperone n=1 Tax=unclassified Caballeronia TaxID=2646786 RepID=UPI001F357F9E|nr:MULTISPECIES: nitrate reductase molybdenum cofactor assembly chaperone [unclassified Caballeronia]MCE4546261.1 nitrate reductase molybdenum cofactor assembly chaperone [Caballeronia sp. PC1]MCE4573264.1 nitrate reductase molybdenum cofactor assembly chaperone [Caballeronia sp. CLC5]BBQ01545.1 respiratory nitrate reductase subunit delta [Burkholderia sp. SFA1]
MSLYSILSALLDYPEPALLDALPEIGTALHDWPQAQKRLAPLVASLKRPLIDSQLTYVSTFDRNPSHSLHLFEHVHGESRDRGQAMVDLLDEYRGLGLDIETNELPDYVPLFLEVLGAIDPDRAQALLNDAIHVLDAIGERLARDESPYAAVFAVLRELATVKPRPLVQPPVRDMDEMLETFGPGPDGVEPLLAPHMRQDTQTIRFHPRDASRGAGAPIAKDAR